MPKDMVSLLKEQVKKILKNEYILCTTDSRSVLTQLDMLFKRTRQRY